MVEGQATVSTVPASSSGEPTSPATTISPTTAAPTTASHFHFGDRRRGAPGAPPVTGDGGGYGDAPSSSAKPSVHPDPSHQRIRPLPAGSAKPSCPGKPR